jgi:hypothetical protein
MKICQNQAVKDIFRPIYWIIKRPKEHHVSISKTVYFQKYFVLKN